MSKQQLKILLDSLTKVAESQFTPSGVEEACQRLASLPGLIHLAGQALEKASKAQQRALVVVLAQLPTKGSREFLDSLVERREVNLAVQLQALSLIRSLGGQVRPKTSFALEKADTWLIKARDILDKGKERTEETATLTQEFAQLPDVLQEKIIDLIAEEGDKSLPFIEQLVGLSTSADIAILRALTRWPLHSAPALADKVLSLAKDKEVRRAAKKTLYLLKGKGLDIPLPESKEATSTVIPREQEPGMALVTDIDYQGQRRVSLAEPRQGGGLSFYHAVISDQLGILEFDFRAVPRKAFREFKEKVEGKKEWLVAETDFSYGCYLIEEAHAINSQQGRRIPEEYLEYRPRFKRSAETIKAPLIYSLFSAEEVKEEKLPLAAASQVAQIKELRGWHLSPETLGDYAKKLAEAGESRLVITKEQRQAMVQGLLEKATRELFTSQLKKVFQRRLEEMAALFFLKGRKDDARIALGAALVFQEESPLLPVHPFALELVRRATSLLMKEEEEEKPLVTLA